MTIRDVLVCLFGAVSGKNEKKRIGICDHGSIQNDVAKTGVNAQVLYGIADGPAIDT